MARATNLRGVAKCRGPCTLLDTLKFGSVAFGALMILNPGAGALAVLWILGAFSVAYGVLLVVLAFKLKKHAGVATPAVA